MDFNERIVTSDFIDEDVDLETSLRPKHLEEYVGQDKIKENLSVYIQAAKNRNEALDHVLLYALRGSEKPRFQTLSQTKWA